MTPICRAFGHLALIGGFALSSACSILPKGEPVDVYRLPVAQVAANKGTGQVQHWSLRVAKPVAGDALNNARIAVLPEGNLISSYKNSRWSDPAPILLRNRLLDGFQRDGRVPLLSTDDSNLQADFELGGELQAFQSQYQGNAVEVVIGLDARLVRGYDQKILASKRFEVRQPLNDPKVPAVVAGFGQAGDALSRQVVDWAVAQGSALYKP
ncbi:ABC-type transport auxiliary lipoprotein family protein [Pseudomonas sp. CF161]|uniref:ABC-type transport auxiliary lipoprotein family protein n=1 Tax=Pseudomonas sp. CF161 TaxID=911241 RepID=UPI0003552516|nr:ABC-type transport auxiliary lipoprotein family protein [Pseudomonas sp. CF161]EPL08345.1 putative lipoprotein [Pseudomonas sp. CF161]